MNSNLNSFIPSKSKGQNFLVDHTTIRNIYQTINDIDQYDAILEIGPGTGVLTNFLIIKNKHLFCVELDKKLFLFLQKKFTNNNNFHLINGDILKIDFDRLFSQFHQVLVVANIPYNITSPIIIKCLTNKKIVKMYFMMQFEVASKIYYYQINHNRNAFSNIVNYCCFVHKFFDVDRNCFFPQPRVNSSFISLTKKNNIKYDSMFHKFLNVIFKFKRKKIINNYPFKKKIQGWLIQHKIDLNIRAEQLDYHKLFKMYKDLSCPENENND